MNSSFANMAVQRRALQQYTCPPSFTQCSSVFCSCSYNYTTQTCAVTCRYWILAFPIAAGLLLLLAICVVALLCYRRRSRRKQQEQQAKEMELAAAHPAVYAGGLVSGTFVECREPSCTAPLCSDTILLPSPINTSPQQTLLTQTLLTHQAPTRMASRPRKPLQCSTLQTVTMLSSLLQPVHHKQHTQHSAPMEQ